MKAQTREEYLARRRAYYLANQERIKADSRQRSAERRLADPEGARKALAEWRRQNSGRAKAWARANSQQRLEDPKRRAEKRAHGVLAASVGAGTASQYAQGADFLRWLRADALEILGPSIQIDHLQPMSSFNLEEHEQRVAANAETNVWWLPKTANRLKGRRPPTRNEVRLHGALLRLFHTWKSNDTTPHLGATTPTPRPAFSPRKRALISSKKIEILKRLKQEPFNTRLLRPETCQSSTIPSRLPPSRATSA